LLSCRPHSQQHTKIAVETAALEAADATADQQADIEAAEPDDGAAVLHHVQAVRSRKILAFIVPRLSFVWWPQQYGQHAASSIITAMYRYRHSITW